MECHAIFVNYSPRRGILRYLKVVLSKFGKTRNFWERNLPKRQGWGKHDELFKYLLPLLEPILLLLLQSQQNKECSCKQMPPHWPQGKTDWVLKGGSDAYKIALGGSCTCKLRGHTLFNCLSFRYLTAARHYHVVRRAAIRFCTAELFLSIVCPSHSFSFVCILGHPMYVPQWHNNTYWTVERGGVCCNSNPKLTLNESPNDKHRTQVNEDFLSISQSWRNSFAFHATSSFTESEFSLLGYIIVKCVCD